MHKYLLSAFEIAELLYLVLMRYEERNHIGEKEEISSEILKTPTPSHLLQIIKVCTIEYSEKFSDKIFGSKRPGTPGYGKSPRLLHEMKNAVEEGHPFYIAEKDLFQLLIHIGKDPLEENPYNQLYPKRITKRMIDLEGTCWSLYYFDKILEDLPSINQAILQFLPFGRVKIKSPHHDYSGFYATYGDQEYYLLMELKTELDRKRDLHILVYYGASKHLEVLLGQYHNVEQRIFSGTLILEPLKGMYNDLLPKTITTSDDEYSKIHKTIRDFFKEENLNKLVITTETLTYKNLAILNSKRNIK